MYCDIPGASNGVCLNGNIPGVQGIVFDNRAAPRTSITAKDTALFEKENGIAIIIATAALDHEPTVSDFPDAIDLEIAKEVYVAKPRIASICSIRVLLIVASGKVKFNTMYML
jgi:hypothetical protein